MGLLAEKLKESLYSVLPITVIVILLDATIAPMEASSFIRFLIGAALVIVGLAVFLTGVDIGITPIGNILGATVARSNKIWIVVIAGLVLGFFISVAEPDLHILAGQVDSVTGGLIPEGSLVIVVSVGIAAMISLGLVRILYNIPLYQVLLAAYAVIFLFSLFTAREFLAISFDASGATTGAMTVPFILALAVGISSMKKDSKASEKDSFGLVAIASTGAILAVMIMSILSGSATVGAAAAAPETRDLAVSVFRVFTREIPAAASDVFWALAPIVIIFFVFQWALSEMPKKAFRHAVFGLLFTFLGLVMLLTGIHAGFMEAGQIVGHRVASLDNKAYLIGIGFVLGLATILAEPAVYVLTRQIEDITSGYVNRKAVMTALAIGVGLAVALSMLRILVPEIQLWHYLLPGYAISLALTFFAPKLFVGIAFDSGGVASGPMTATFILAFASGAADAIEGANVLVDGFGMISMVALTPLITLQLLGLIFKLKSKQGGVESSDGAL